MNQSTDGSALSQLPRLDAPPSRSSLKEADTGSYGARNLGPDTDTGELPLELKTLGYSLT